jgi:hypothetical protein
MITLRPSTELHARIKEAAHTSRLSMNAFCTGALLVLCVDQELRDRVLARFRALVEEVPEDLREIAPPSLIERNILNRLQGKSPGVKAAS